MLVTATHNTIVPAGWPTEISADKLHECVAAMPTAFHPIAGAILSGSPPPSMEQLVESWMDEDGEAFRVEAAETSRPIVSEPELACHGPVKVVGVTDIAGVGAMAAAGYRGFTDGLNVVFGENGSGKSSLAAIIKEAGSSRLPADVLANVYADDNPPASATIHLSVDGEEAAHEWSPNRPDARLLRIRVYDAGCGDSYIERGAEASVLPGPVQAVAALVRYAGELRSALQRAAQSSDDALAVPPNTPVHDAWMRGDVAELESLARVDAQEMARLSELLASAHASGEDLLGEAAAWRSRVQSFDEVRAAAEEAFASFNALDAFREGLIEIAGLRADLSSADAVADSSARQLRRLLVAADVSWSSSDLEECPMCSRPFRDDELAEFLSRIRASRAEDQLRLEKEERKLEGTRERWRDHALRLRELDRSDSGMPLGDWMSSCAETLELLASDGEIESSPAPPDVAVLVAQAEEASARASALESMGRESGDRAGELRALEARAWLRDHVEQVRAALAARARSEGLEADAKRLDTKKLSGLQRKLTGTLLTQRYQAVLASTLEFLLPNISLHLVDQVRKGAVQYQAVLTRATKGTKVASVLSEGERRLAGLAFFLTEAEVFGNGDTLVLDDPVSSMDESRRAQVAMRLARLARGRQVIVVTHDLVFVEMLKGYAKPDRPHECEVQRVGPAAGIFDAGIGRLANFKASKSKLNGQQQRLVQLEKQITERTDSSQRTEAQRTYEATQGAFVRTFRGAVERFVEERLLLGVVTRFERGIGTSKLGEISVTRDQVDLVRELMSVSSLDLHDSSDALAAQPPDAGRAKAMLGRLAELESTAKTAKSKKRRS